MFHDFTCLWCEITWIGEVARRSIIDYPGAFYHVINRGNDRSFIFETAGALKSFLKCLDQCCTAQRWRLHAWVLIPLSGTTTCAWRLLKRIWSRG